MTWALHLNACNGQINKKPQEGLYLPSILYDNHSHYYLCLLVFLN